LSVGHYQFYIGQVALPPGAPPDNGSNALFGWFIGLLIAVGVLTLVARPLLMGGNTLRRTQPETLRNKLENLQDKAAAEEQTLKDLEFDREMGAIEERDYDHIKTQAAANLATITGEIEQLERSFAPPAAKAKSSASVNGNGTTSRSKSGTTTVATKARTNEAIRASVREKLKCGECATPSKPREKFCSKCHAPLPVLCLNCGKEVQESERFCSKCGSAVNT
jgi:Double zinc ribbon